MKFQEAKPKQILEHFRSLIEGTKDQNVHHHGDYYFVSFELNGINAAYRLKRDGAELVEASIKALKGE